MKSHWHRHESTPPPVSTHIPAWLWRSSASRACRCRASSSRTQSTVQRSGDLKLRQQKVTSLSSRSSILSPLHSASEIAREPWTTCHTSDPDHLRLQISPVATGGDDFGGLSFPKQGSKSLQIEKWKTINQWSFYQFFNVSPSCSNVKPPLLKTFWRRFCSNYTHSTQFLAHTQKTTVKFKSSGHTFNLPGCSKAGQIAAQASSNAGQIAAQASSTSRCVQGRTQNVIFLEKRKRCENS